MRPRRVAALLSQVFALLTVAMVVPAVATFWQPRTHGVAGVAIPGELLPMVTAVLIPAVLWVACSFFAADSPLRDHEAYLGAALGWLVAILVGSLPYLFLGLEPLTAVVASTSASTATPMGPSLESFALQVWRGIQQWLAGLFAIGFGIALLSRLTPSGGALLQSERPGPKTGLVRTRLEQTFRAIFLPYLAFTGFAFIGFLVLVRDASHAFLLALAGVSTGGMVAVPDVAEPLMAMVAIIAATGALIWVGLLRRKWAVLGSLEWRAWMIGMASAGALVAFFMWRGGFSVVDGLYATISAATTSGFHATQDHWPSSVLLILMLFLFSGAMIGSSSGGIKVARLLVVGLAVWRELRRLLHPRAMIPVRYRGNALRDDTVTGVFGFMFVYLTAWMIGTMLLVLLEPGQGLYGGTILAASALGNTSIRSVDLAGLHATSQFVMAALMWLGRLDILAALLLFSRHGWRSY